MVGGVVGGELVCPGIVDGVVERVVPD